MTEKEQNISSNVERLARELPHDIQPSTDLWPGIEARLETPCIDQSSASNRRWPQAMAVASVLVMVSSLTTMMWLRGTATPDPASVKESDRSVTIGAGLRAPELLAISELSDEDRDIVIINLDIVRAARADIEQALKKDPNNTGLHNAWLRVYEQELDLLNEAIWTTNGLAERVKT